MINEATSPAPILPLPCVTTRGQASKMFQCQFTDRTIRYDPNRRVFLAVPTTHHLALNDPAWRTTMEAEFGALLQN